MARKSKEMHQRERLMAIGTCPYDVFDVFPSDDASFELIARAERGDLSAIREIVGRAYTRFYETREPKDVLLHYLLRGVALGDMKLTGLFLMYFCLTHLGAEHVEDAIAVIEAGDKPFDPEPREIALFTTPEALLDLITCAKLNYAVTLISKDGDLERALELTKCEHPTSYTDERLYVLAKCREAGLAVDREVMLLSELISRLDGLCYLDCLGRIGPRIRFDHPGIIYQAITNLIELTYYYTDLDWTDFWHRCLFEYCAEYRQGNFIDMAAPSCLLSERRTYVPKHTLHSLAWAHYCIKYHTENNDIYYKDVEKLYPVLKKRCLFEGLDIPDLDDDEVLHSFMRESVYLNSRRESARFVEESRLGNRIIQPKNRYSLECTLEGHKKRGRMHTWDTVISISLPEGRTEPPTFYPLVVRQANNDVTRGGVSLPHNKSASQLLLYSELDAGEGRLPFLLDLILDIAYICASKCGEGKIVVKGYEIKDGYAVMSCRISLY